jgi:hypothetical protein
MDLQSEEGVNVLNVELDSPPQKLPASQFLNVAEPMNLSSEKKSSTVFARLVREDR